jgi:hypothetical protein
MRKMIINKIYEEKMHRSETNLKIILRRIDDGENKTNEADLYYYSIRNLFFPFVCFGPMKVLDSSEKIF